MKKSFLKPLVIAGFGIVLFSGCSTKQFKTEIIETSTNKHRITTDQDYTKSARLMLMQVARTNYKYAFGAAATLAKDNGFKYFSIDDDFLAQQFRARNVKTIQDAYDACDTNGEGGFRWAFMSMNNITGDSKCDTILEGYMAQKGVVEDNRLMVRLEVFLHNENKQDSITFNADEVLASDLLKGLNMDYFKNGTRTE